MFAAKNDAKMCILVFSTTPDSGAAKFGFLFDLDDGLVIMKKGFGIVEVMVSIVVLGFMYVALSKLQGSNHDAVLRIRGRDAALEVAQEVLDSLNAKGVATIPVSSISANDTTFELSPVHKSWTRGLGGDVTVAFKPIVTVGPSQRYVAHESSNYDADVKHTYAKFVNVKVEWMFKNSTQSIDVAKVIR